jgi:hypothetical protein
VEALEGQELPVARLASAQVGLRHCQDRLQRLFEPGKAAGANWPSWRGWWAYRSLLVLGLHSSLGSSCVALLLDCASLFNCRLIHLAGPQVAATGLCLYMTCHPGSTQDADFAPVGSIQTQPVVPSAEKYSSPISPVFGRSLSLFTIPLFRAFTQKLGRPWASVESENGNSSQCHGGNSLGKRAYSAFWTWATALSALKCGSSWVTRGMKAFARARMTESPMK